jgi:hypothetical protein
VLNRLPVTYAKATVPLELDRLEEPVKMDEDEQEKLFAKLKLLGYME